jgi:hypothetical protein
MGSPGSATSRGRAVLLVGAPPTAVAALVTAGAPTPVIVLTVLATVLVGLAQIVFPQESQHKLDWWRGWWHRSR